MDRLALIGPSTLRSAVAGATSADHTDVIGDDLASIASGPCAPDPTSAAEVRAALESAGLWSRIPAALREVVGKAILEKLNKDVNAAVHSPGMKTPLENLGMVGLGDKSLQQFDDFVKSETVRWAKVITEANLAGTQ